MAWRALIETIFDHALGLVDSCIEEARPEECSKSLLSGADAVYSPLKPIDAGLGEARRLAARLAGLIADYFIYRLYTVPEGDEKIKAVYEELKKTYTELGEPAEYTKKILEGAGAPAVEPAWAKEAREGLVKTLKDYVEPEPSQALRRRRREPRRLDPVRDAKIKLRELGRLDPLLARRIQEILSSHGMSLFTTSRP